MKAKFLKQFPVKLLVTAISVISVCAIMFQYSSIIIFLGIGKPTTAYHLRLRPQF